jgi:hypothetical protein
MNKIAISYPVSHSFPMCVLTLTMSLNYIKFWPFIWKVCKMKEIMESYQKYKNI